MCAKLMQNPAFARASETMRAGIERGEAELTVIAVANGKETLHVDSAAPEPLSAAVSPDSIFLLASITKPFIGTAVAQLAQEGHLAYTDTVTRYIPEFRQLGKEKVNLWHLLTHTSGLADEVSLPVWLRQGTAAEHLQAGIQAHLYFPPGSAYRYSNITFWILAEIIGRVSGLDYKDYIAQRICAPLNMPDTTFCLTEQQRGRLVPVRVEPKEVGFSAEYYLSLGLPAGGICSTAADLVRFGQAMLAAVRGESNPLLSPAAARTITALHTAGIRDFIEGTPATYGLGWAKPSAFAGTLGSPAGFGHGGATGTLLWVEPDYDLVYVFLNNQWADSRVKQLALNAVLGSL